MIYRRTPDYKTPNALKTSFGYDPTVDHVDSPEVERTALTGVEFGKMAYGAVMVESELQEGSGHTDGTIDTPITPEDKERERLKHLFAFPEARGRDRFGNDLDMRLRV
ncbi:hypothetical protein H7Y29_01795, partial [Microbacteriaceae bacterium]|nr:hypothetical protein [Candidatus Saccharibacteria bacterium]